MTQLPSGPRVTVTVPSGPLELDMDEVVPPPLLVPAELDEEPELVTDEPTPLSVVMDDVVPLPACVVTVCPLIVVEEDNPPAPEVTSVPFPEVLLVWS
jgi:hypothetical protein